MATERSDQTSKSGLHAEGHADPFSALGQVTVELFESHLSSKFFADLNSAIVSPSLEPGLDRIDKSCPVELELVEVTRYPNIGSGAGAGGREPFSLVFLGPHQSPLVSALYTVSHSTLTELNLFMNPVQISTECRPDEDPDGLYYEVCFT